jgi:hypothetical protein
MAIAHQSIVHAFGATVTQTYAVAKKKNALEDFEGVTVASK